MTGTEEPTYAVQVLRPFWSLLRRYPQVPVELIDQVEREFAEKRMPIRPAQELLLGTVALTGDPDLGLKAARETTTGDFEVLEYVGASASTWRDAIESFFRYSKLVNGAANFHLEVQGTQAHAVLNSTVPLSRVSADFQVAAFLVAIARWQQDIPPELEVRFKHAQPADISEYRKTFGGSKLSFSAPHDGFVFDAARLETPLRTADPSLHKVLRAHAESLLAELAPGDSLTERVRGHILESMGEGRATAEEAARRLGMSRRTLTRKLSDEGTNFKELLSSVRHHTALHYLEETGHSVEDIAFLLGFSESPPFVRAFKRWVGVPPLEYRRRQRA